MSPSIAPALVRVGILAAGLFGVKVSPEASADILELAATSTIVVEALGHWWERRKAAKRAAEASQPVSGA